MNTVYAHPADALLHTLQGTLATLPDGLLYATALPILVVLWITLFHNHRHHKG